MQFENIRLAMVLVQISVDGIPGLEKMVMNGTVQNVDGPLVSKKGNFYLPIPGKMIVTDIGGPVHPDVICVGEEPVIKLLTTPGGQLCRILVKDFRYQPPERRYR